MRVKLLGRSALSAFVRSAAVVAVASLALTACGSTKATPKAKPTLPTPSSSVAVPTGITLTPAGAKLDFGQSANVAYAPNPQRSTVLELTVLSVHQGTIADLGSYVLDDRTKASTPYYVRVKVKNVGEGDVGQTPIPLWAVDNTNTLIQASSFTNSFTKCPSKALPTSFAPNTTVRSCLVYLVPDHGTLTGVSFRPLQAFEPILWTGTVVPPAADKKKAS